MERLYGNTETSAAKDLRNIFGSSYLVLSNFDELSRNYQDLLSLRNRKLIAINNFIAEDNPRTKLYLESWELDLLLLTPFPGKEDNKMKDYTYYCFKELDFIKLLKAISTGSYELSEEEYNLLYKFIRNRLAIEELMSLSQDGVLALNLQIVKVIYELVRSRQVTIGHNIKAYERLCQKLNLSKLPNGPYLELKSTNN